MTGTCLLVMVLSAAPAANNAATLAWSDNYTDALKKTQDTDKPLLVVLHDPSQPELCAEYATDRPESAHAELLQGYELCRVDVTTEHGQKVAKAFKVDQFPFMAVIDKSGSGILHRHAGPLKPEQWMEKLEAFQDGELRGNVSGSRARTTTYSRSRRTYTPSTCYT